MANSAKHRDRAFIRSGLVARRAANADPTTRCRDCGLTLAERRRTHPTATWDWGHPRHPWTAYGIECSHCNRADGARQTNSRRFGNSLGL